MTASKSSNSSALAASSRIACYGTAFLAGTPVDIAALKCGISSGAPQISSPRLDASFLANCGSFLSGKSAAIDDPRTYFKRLTGNDFSLPKAQSKATHVYQFSAKLCDLLAALTEERAAEIAMKWYGTNLPAKTKSCESNGRTQRRLAILRNLAALARQAQVGNTVLILRVEYRKQRLA